MPLGITPGRTASLPQRANTTVFLRDCCGRNVGGMTTPQQLSREAIEEFKAIYQEEFGTQLTDDEVQEIALRLLRFFGLLRQPPFDGNHD